MPVRIVVPTSPDDSTLILEWIPPASPNGIVLNYIVIILLFGSGQSILEANTMSTAFTASGLSKLTMMYVYLM